MTAVRWQLVLPCQNRPSIVLETHRTLNEAAAQVWVWKKKRTPFKEHARIRQIDLFVNPATKFGRNPSIDG